MFTFIRLPAAKSSLVFTENSRVHEMRNNMMLRILVLMVLVVMFATAAPVPGESHHVHVKIHVPKHFHTHTHTIVKKVFVPVKKEIEYKPIHSEEHKYHDEGGSSSW
ncbi:uncharacterized protein [Fopius arisanus]|uniref:Uncharacterized protein n=1 Tax=Fopius arisanus TaxID=64838 RepID=A0A9R1TXG7_9HYME|nr:PREDICTED: uncharacterized protein LOC105264752 [Fopius arisanus]